MYLHYRDVHSPYAPPPPYHQLFLPSSNVEPDVDMLSKMGPLSIKNLDTYISQYDGEIRYTSDYIEKTLKMLEKYDINRRNSIIIITADHGEEFLDCHPGDNGGKKHGRTLYMEQIHVPLIISIPGISAEKKIITSYVELNDIAPTILDVLDISWKEYNQFQGRSLIPLIEGVDNTPREIYSGGNYDRGIIIEKGYKYYFYDKYSKRNRSTFFVRPSSDYHYEFGEELYNIAADPLETKNVIDQKKTVVLKLKEKLHKLKESFLIRKESQPVDLDKVTIEQLKSLGYLQ